jgi:hypothetical protein
MSYAKAVLLLIQITATIVRYLDERRLLTEGQKIEVANELARVSKIVARAKKIQSEVEKMNDAQVDNALSGDFRD